MYKTKKVPLLSKIVAVIAVIALIGCLAGWLVINDKLNLIERIDDESRIDRDQETFEDGENNGGEVIDANDVILDNDNIETFTASDVANILFIGCDARPGETRGRSDSMIICSINKHTKEIKLTSLMRDTYVTIPGYSKNRLNAAYAFGGMSLLDETIENNFGIHIDGNVAVDFDSFVEALTAVGTLDIDLTKREADYLNTNPSYSKYNWNLKEGINSLMPEQTLAYARIRKVGDGDFERTERQRKVITTAYNKVKDLTLSEILALADKVLPCITTDMRNTTIFSYVAQVAGSHYSMGDTLRIPVDGGWQYAMINGTMSVVIPNLEMNSEAIKTFIYGDTLMQAGNID